VRYEWLLKAKFFTNIIRLLTVSLELAHPNYLAEVANTSELHLTEPDKLVQENFGSYFRRMGFKKHLTGGIVFIQ
jgi:hypothetical protein